MTSKVVVLGLVLAASVPAWGQSVSGTAFDDRNGNGIQDAGEPSLPSVQVEVYGTRDVGGAFDQAVTTGADGKFAFSPGNGCYLILAADPAGWRGSFSRFDSVSVPTPGYVVPVGFSRFAKFDHAIGALKTGSYRYTAMGDSIAANFNVCFDTSSFYYAKQEQSRLGCTGGITVALDQAAVSGQKTDDLLVDDTADNNNVFRVMAMVPPPSLITISMIGNDLRDVDPSGTPTQAQINKAVDEILDSRENLQEVLSAFTSQIPGADISLNTLYDNLAYNCYSGDSTAFHRAWLPIVNRILRDLAWGQARRASVNEVAAEFAHEDQNVQCTGFDGMICRDAFNLDDIHPTMTGYTIIREKVWEAGGGANLGPKDTGTQRTSITNANYGYLKRIRRLLPTKSQAANGGTVANPSAAFDDADGGATASIQLGIGQEEVRVTGFPDYYDEDQIVKVVAGVRYRTSGTVTDDFYRIEASPTGTFRAPAGYSYTTTNWNFYTPIVGGGGPNQPASNADYPTEKLLALPNVPTLREVSATLTKNPALPPGAGEYDWPAITRSDIATTAIRVVSAPVASTAGDAYQVELDAAWLDLYGWQKPRPGEVTNLTEAKLPDGTIDVAFNPLASAQRYNVYWGRLDTLRSGAYDHGTNGPVAPSCAATTQDAGGGRLEVAFGPGQQPGVDAYILVTAHVDNVESPAGTRSDLTEIDRSQSVCN
ncbi:MAG TPA: SGNH/GDSL hydrolase family protein [Candidatus Polarisedimenticolaceae bacterium]|nr:SGNH/GDSL hydrolase family protein [Candidatus Polarisedimenticolaceae bacterium]